ncbi:MAG: dynamin family protein [Candidatus Brocadiae bacterium]|nr:dynamin family protein [Candidatus Brocadiia bacterium]
MIISQEYSKELGSLVELIRKTTKKLSPDFLKKHPDFESPLEDIKPIPTIGFLGGFSVGKSTTVNAILQGTLEDEQCVGKEDVTEVKKLLEYRLSPVDILPTTVCGILFRYGKKFEARFYLEKESSFLSMSKSISDIKEYLEFIQDRHKLVTMSFIEILLPHPFLEKYCEILDMPGHKSILDEDKSRLLAMVEKCDGLVYLVSQRGMDKKDEDFITSLLQPLMQIKENGVENIVRNRFLGPISFWLNFNEKGKGNPSECYRHNRKKVQKLVHNLEPYFIKRIFGGSEVPFHCFDSFNSMDEEMQHFYEYLIYFSQVATLYRLDHCREQLYAQTYNVDERLKALLQGRRNFLLLEKIMPGKYSAYLRPLLLLNHLHKLSQKMLGENITREQIHQIWKQQTNPTREIFQEEYKKDIYQGSSALRLASILYELGKLSKEQKILQKMEEVYPDFGKFLFGKPTYLTFGKRQLSPLPISNVLKKIEERFCADSDAIAKCRLKQIEAEKLDTKQKKFKPLSEQEKLERRTLIIKQHLLLALQNMFDIYKKYYKNYSFLSISPNFCDEAKKQIVSNQYLLPVCGTFSSGKSTFLNALLDNHENNINNSIEILPVDDTPTTAFITELHYSEQPYAQLDWWSGTHKRITILEWEKRASFDKKGYEIKLRLCHEEIEYLEELCKLQAISNGLPKIKSCQIFRLNHGELQEYNFQKIIEKLPKSPYSKTYEFTSGLEEQTRKKAIQELKKDLLWEDPIQEIYLEFSEKPSLILPLQTEEQMRVWKSYQKTCYSFLVKKAHIFWPLPMLQHICLVDTPGFHSTIKTHDEITEDYLNHCSTCIFLISGSQPLTQDDLNSLRIICNNLKHRKKEGHSIAPLFIIITKADLLKYKEVKHPPVKFVEEQLYKEFFDIKEYLLIREISVFNHLNGKDNRFRELIQDISLKLCESSTYKRIEESNLVIQKILEKEIQKVEQNKKEVEQKIRQYQTFIYNEKTEILHEFQKEQNSLRSKQEETQDMLVQEKIAYQNIHFALERIKESLSPMQSDELDYIEQFVDEKDFEIFRDGYTAAPSWWQFWKKKRSGISWSSHISDMEKGLEEELQKICKRYERKIQQCFLPVLPSMDSSELRYALSFILENCYERSVWTFGLKKFQISEAKGKLKSKIRTFFDQYRLKLEQWIQESKSIVLKLSCDSRQRLENQLAQIEQKITHYECEIQRWHDETKEDKEIKKQSFERQQEKLQIEKKLFDTILDDLKNCKKIL